MVLIKLQDNLSDFLLSEVKANSERHSSILLQHAQKSCISSELLAKTHTYFA